MFLKDSDLFVQSCYINDQWVQASETDQIIIQNPATNEILGKVPKINAALVNQTIQQAHNAWKNWKNQTTLHRADLLHHLYINILEAQTELAQIITAEQGKPLKEAQGEVIYAANFIRWFAEEARRAYGDIIPASDPKKRLLVLKQPIGVCAAITPWNFPCAMLARKLAPALAAGCTMIVKPAPETPFSALALAVLAQRAGIPAGVLNIITGDAIEIGGALMTSPLVRKLSFTGSTEVGRLLMQQSAQTLKKVSLELGGNAPFIVFEDANLESAVEGAITAKFRNNGQTCVCANRFFIQNSIYEEFTQLFSKRVAQLRVGNGADAETDLGPLIHSEAVNQVEQLLQNALQAGAQLKQGGNRLKGNFFEPTILTEVTPSMQIAYQEAFGPIAPLIRFQNLEDVMQMANDTEYGLASYCYTQNLSRSWQVAEQLEYGIVGINTGLISTVEAPFGGIKQSGLGREGSKYGMDDYLEVKYICLQI